MAKSMKFIIEALLFASESPLSVSDIHNCLPEASLTEIRGALKVLTYEYETMGRSFSLKEVAGGYQLRTHSEYGPYILKMFQTSPSRLSRAAMETLSIIAYKQPIIRQEIERIRGVDVGSILRTLLEKGLIRILGRKDLPGRPLIYGTTKKFLEVFDLKDLKSLPKLKEIKDLGSDEFEPGTPEQLVLAELAPPPENTDEESEQQLPVTTSGDGPREARYEETSVPQGADENILNDDKTHESTKSRTEETAEEYPTEGPIPEGKSDMDTTQGDSGKTFS